MYDVIYCNYDVRSQRFSFIIWVTPISSQVWICLFCTFFLTAAILALQRNLSLRKKNKMKLCTALWDSVFDIYSLMTRQDSGSVTSPPLFFTLSFASLVMLSIYEFYVTAELVVPEIPAKLGTLPKLLSLGYKLHHVQTTHGYDNITEIFKDDFKRMKISQWLETRLVEMETPNLLEISGKFHKQNPSFAWIFEGSNGGSEVLINLV